MTRTNTSGEVEFEIPTGRRLWTQRRDQKKYNQEGLIEELKGSRLAPCYRVQRMNGAAKFPEKSQGTEKEPIGQVGRKGSKKSGNRRRANLS
ncbi:hypothetical protein C922_05461 [Plasmodium inui San Antonio 1]|uniref:Uncharacterized protein n=1 Tax=Plasmodium inui San Antonio 1 TaxID=1237626 RepID=W6ZXX3_9APIC|nr:hypothetical protein C922_05461 [Plasmodium inui San Antonio 1]EUD64158.1 hypothetical protein C922_05461 [Plasmodium inui San Antonio 1]